MGITAIYWTGIHTVFFSPSWPFLLYIMLFICKNTIGAIAIYISIILKRACLQAFICLFVSKINFGDDPDRFCV